MTSATFRHIDLSTVEDGRKPWVKVDGPGQNFSYETVQRDVTDIRSQSEQFTTENSGFQLINSPAKEKLFTDETAIREGYYAEIESLLKKTLSGVAKVHIFDHTVRRRKPDAPRQPVQQVHVDQTPSAVATRVRRHLPDEAEELLQRRHALINIWRPIEHEAADFPLAVIDYRSTVPSDFVDVDLMYPVRADSPLDDDDRGREVLPSGDHSSLKNYEVKGETMGVKPSTSHRFYYASSMKPDEVLLLKCFDSIGEGQPGGIKGLATRTPHTAFEDPKTPKDAKPRQSIEVRALVFYDE